MFAVYGIIIPRIMPRYADYRSLALLKLPNGRRNHIARIDSLIPFRLESPNRGTLLDLASPPRNFSPFFANYASYGAREKLRPRR